MRTGVIALLLAAVAGCTGTRSLTRDINEPPRMVEAILSQVPVGTPTDDAQRLMEREGFTCSRETGGKFLDRSDLDYVSCHRSTCGLFSIVSRDWWVALVYRDGKVTEVLAHTVLTGP
jgi:hypothetical protein